MCCRYEWFALVLSDFSELVRVVAVDVMYCKVLKLNKRVFVAAQSDE